MWATGISMARERARQNRDFTECKRALSLEGAIQSIKTAKIGNQQFEDVTVFLGSQTVYDANKRVAVHCFRHNWPHYEPADFSVYEGVDREHAVTLSKVSVLRAPYLMATYWPGSRNWKMLREAAVNSNGGAKALERLHELYA